MSRNKFPPKPRYDPDTGPVYLYGLHTVRAALDELVDFGRPRRVELAVLIDRGHRELPIQADYVGKDVQTTDSEIVKVMLKDYDEDEQVVVVENE